MNKSKSYPLLSSDVVQPMRKSTSLSDLNESDYYFEEFFEGDGNLGIVFTEDKSNIVVQKILPNTVASETFGLYIQMILIEVDGRDVTNMSFKRVSKLISKGWNDNNRIYLKFKKQIFPRLSKILNQFNLLKYYDLFVDLGAKDETDLEYIIEDDLIKMDMTKDEIQQFKKINPNI